MKNSFMLLLGILLALYSCKNKKSGDSNRETKSDTLKERKVVKTTTLKIYKDTYFLETDTVSETLKVNRMPKKTIEFQWIIINKKTGSVDTLSGVAVDKTPGQDLEIDEDEEGISYPAEEFTYHNICEVNFRISVDKEIKRARINSTNCKLNDGRVLKSNGSLKWKR